MYPPPSWKPPGVKSTKKTASVHSAVMATTRAATFSAKIRTLSDFHSRIINQQQTPSSAEMITTLRYFQQTLVSFLKDIPSERSSLFKKYNSENAIVRTGLYPNLNYSGLFYGIVNLLDAFPMISSAQTTIAEAILDTLKALYFFLDRECIEQLPLLLASQLGVFPSEIDRRLVHLLCDCIFPYSFGDGINGQVSVPAVLILVLHHSADNSLHTLIIERLAYYLPDLYNDLLKVIASGTSESRITAVNLLFHYWPLLNPGIMLRKTIQYRVHPWSSTPCQYTQCVEKGPSTRLIYEPSICASFGDTSPPMFICNNCEKSISSSEPMPYLSQPLPALISTTCQNKGCTSTNRISVGTCFDEDCIRSNGHIPLRLCNECFNSLHPIENTRAYEHIRHKGYCSVWGTLYERVMVESIVKLLRETSSKLTELSADGESAKRPKWLRQLEGGRELGREIDHLSDERRMLSRFGIWLMVANCPPVPEANFSSVGYLLGALFQWFSTTALLPNDAMGQTLEQLKSDFGCEWLNQALSNHYQVFISELLPPQLEPIYENNNEDTIWDERFVRKEIMREGLSKLLALAPYDIISIDIWSKVMPFWLNSLNTDLIGEEDLLELKVPISKLFEPDLCALPFEPQRLYEFLAIRLQSNSYSEILKALDWLHLLSRIDIRISLQLLLNMFSNSLLKIPLPTSNELLIQNKENEESKNEENQINNSELASPEIRDNKLIEEKKIDENIQQTFEGPMSAQLIMTDILAQQIKLAGGASVMTSETLLEQLFSIIAALLEYQSEENFIKNGWHHSCRDPEGDQFADCLRCQQALFLYQVLLQVLEQFCPKEESRLEALTYGDETARDFADWLSEASSSLHQQQTQSGVVAGGNSPRPSLSPHALSSSSPAGHTFFGSPITQKRQQQQQQQTVQKTSTPLIKAKQEVSTPSAEMVGALPTDDVESTNAQVAAFSFAEQTPLGMACVSETVIGVLQQQEAILAGKNVSEAIDGDDKQKSGRIEQKEEKRLFWETSVGRFRFSLEQLPAQLRLTFVLLTNIEREPDPDVQFFLLSILKYLFLHRECLLNARKEQEHRGFLVWIQENLLIPRLWTLLRSDYSHVGQMATPLILHAITLPLGDDVFWETVNAEFTSPEWERRLKAVDRVLVLAHFVPPNAVRSNRTLLTSLSCAFSHLIVSVHDPNPAVAQKAILLLEALPRSSLTLICHCLEAQFDSCILDRPLIIARIHLLSVILPDESLLSWDFFLQRFETLALEAHLKSQQNSGADASIHFLQDLLHSDPMSDVYQRKVTRARQSLNEADNVRSIVRSLRENSLRHQLNPGVRGDQVDLAHPLVQSTMSASSLSPRAIGSDSRYGRMREFTDEESNLCLLLNRVVDMQNPERHTVSLVVSLFVHFLANKRCGPADNAKKLSVLLRHFNALLGYSNSEKCFTIPPARLRRAAVCNAFLHGLPGILDSNLLIGNQLLSIVLQLLLYLPSPQKFASDAPSADYSLRLLSAQQRHNWLHSIIIILYKYRCDTAPTNEAIRKQMLIVVQTLEQQCHRCPSPSSSNQCQEQQQPVPIAPENKERRSATCLLDPPGQDGQWSSSTEDSEFGNDSGVEESINNEQLKEKRFASVDDEEILKEQQNGSITATKSSMQTRPESLRIMAIRENGGNSTDIFRKESTKTVVKGTEMTKNFDNRPPVIALHPPAGIKRSRRRPHSQKQQKSIRKQRSNKPRQRGVPEFTRLCCSFCGGRLEAFDEETLSLCCVALCTFLQRVPILAAPLLQRTLLCTARFIDTPQFPWHETNIFVPGNSKSAAKQLIRIILHQLSGSGIALQLFNLHIQATELYSFWNKIAQSLLDFNELNPVAFLQNLLEDIADSWPLRVTRILHNLAVYIQFIPIEAISNWTAVVNLIDGLYRRMHTQLVNESTSNNTATISNNAAQSSQNSIVNNQQKQYRSELTSSVLIMSRILRVQGLATIKGAVQAIEAFAKWLVEMLHKCPIELCDLLAVCTACNRGMIRERDKQIITRSVVAELLAALKFKCELSEENYLTIVRMVLQDFGDLLGDDWTNLKIFENENEEENEIEINKNNWKFNYFQQQIDQFNTGAAEAIRPHVPELLEFIADMNVLAKLKKQFASNSDRVGGDLKAGLAEVIALEMSRPSVRDSRTVMRFIPWLYSPPSLAQALPNQFAESVANVRVLSWILLGALHARGLNGFGNNFQQQQQQVNIPPQSICLPVPIACSTQMADYINFVLAGFADQSKQSVVHMSALFHAFHLCQLWTIYCEQTASLSRSEDMVTRTMQQLLDFWARVTPAILQLLSHSKVLADMVNLHFVNTLQALQQVNSAVLCQLYPMWEPILTVNHANVPRKLRLKFESVDSQIPLENTQMRSWLSKVRYKISQIELQTSASSPFYNV